VALIEANVYASAKTAMLEKSARQLGTSDRPGNSRRRIRRHSTEAICGSNLRPRGHLTGEREYPIAGRRYPIAGSRRHGRLR
jgi:hypothetical protein